MAYRIKRGETVKIRKTMADVEVAEALGWVFDGECDDSGNPVKAKSEKPMSKRLSAKEEEAE
jgi:hypothetical protein